MKFFNYITEDIRSDIKTTLEQDCKEYLKLLSICKRGNNWPHFYRGVDKIFDGAIVKRTTRKDRMPKDTSEYTHKRFDALFQKKFGWKPRSEGLFVSASYENAESYSKDAGINKAYETYPIGNVKYIWCPYVQDFFTLTTPFWPGGEQGKNKGFKADNNYKEEMWAILQQLDKEKYYDEIANLKMSHEISDIVAEIIVDSYIDKGICKASRVDNEVMFKCDSYYLVDRDWGL